MSMAIDGSVAPGQGARSWKRALWRGFRRRCPNCGTARVLGRSLKVADVCGHCREELYHHRADDAPPYFTIFIVGHIVVPAALAVERLWAPPLDVQFVVWTLASLALTLALMPRVKGAVIGLQWALRMHGFDYAAGREAE
jgi:uncharacterized protein (DUF983 family)